MSAPALLRAETDPGSRSRSASTRPKGGRGDDERHEHDEKRGVPKRGTELDHRIGCEAHRNRREPDVSIVDRAPEAKRAETCEREQDEDGDHHRHGSALAEDRLMDVDACVEEGAAPTCQWRAKRGITGGEPGAQVDSGVGPPQERRDRRGGEHRRALALSVHEFPADHGHQREPERLLDQGQERQAGPGGHPAPAGMRRESAQQ